MSKKSCHCCTSTNSQIDEKKSPSDQASTKKEAIRLALSLALMIAGLIFEDNFSKIIVFIYFFGVFLLAGHEVVLNAIKNCFKGKIFDENFLMTIASIGAFSIGEMEEAVAVMIFYGFGELLQEIAVKRSKKNITKLMDIRPDFANLKMAEGIKVVSPSEIKIGDIILIKPGEKVPLDGIIIKGESFIDVRALTGESIPKKVRVGDDLLSGSINSQGVLEIQVTKNFSQSTVSKILELVENAQNKKAESEKFITKFARVYTPIVVIFALATATLPPLFGFGSFSQWLYKALTFLIISCPCALVVSIPVSFFGGIGAAARKGILIKGGNFLEAINNLNTIVFDKTGTLTKGTFEVFQILPEKSYSTEKLLELAAIAEQHSTHPIALSIMQAYKNSANSSANTSLIENAEITEEAGFGIIAKTAQGTILCGNKKLLEKNKIHADNIANGTQSSKTTVYIALNQTFIGSILIADELKPSTKQGIAELKQKKIERLVMLTGDNQKIAKEIANEVGIDEFYAELLPQDKVATFEQILQENQKHKNALSGFVGDGINDAPVLMRADVGFAMGSLGSDAAIEAADVVIMNDDIKSIGMAIKIAKKTRTIVTQNIVFSLGTKVLIMASAIFFATPIWLAIFADVGVSFLAVVNAVRTLNVKE
ncbi:MAG: heavy metal translocating P-type ATPase [Treponemataceae bacterium]